MDRRPFIRILSWRAWGGAGCALVLAACSNPFGKDAPSLSEVLSSGWLFQDEEPLAAVVESPLYCYGTIGKQDCYLEPLPREQRRLIGYQGPPPQARDDL